MKVKSDILISMEKELFLNSIVKKYEGEQKFQIKIYPLRIFL